MLPTDTETAFALEIAVWYVRVAEEALRWKGDRPVSGGRNTPIDYRSEIQQLSIKANNGARSDEPRHGGRSEFPVVRNPIAKGTAVDVRQVETVEKGFSALRRNMNG